MKSYLTLLPTLLLLTAPILATQNSAAFASAASACAASPASATTGYLAALSPHASAEDGAGAPCPTIVAAGKTVQYFLAANSAACCAETASAHVLGQKAAACCPCGALCTGFFPKVLDWTATNGKFVIAKETPFVTSTKTSLAAKSTGS